MAKGLFVNFSEQDVLAIQARAKALLLEGKTIMSHSSQGTSVGKAFTMPVADVLEECVYALRKINPTAYPSTGGIRRHYYGGSIQ